ncbi:MAG: Hsp70 family protein, partial [Terriglobia bacterium]
QRKEEIEIKNRADNMIYSTEKTLKEHRDKVGEVEAKNIEAALEDAKKAVQGNDTSQITAAVERLTQASYKLAEAMYKQADSGSQTGPAGQTGSAGGSASGDGGAGASSAANGGQGQDRGAAEGEVIDAEVVDSDEKKKD